MKSQRGRYIIGKPKAPAPPDPAKTAGAQTANNIGTAIANANLQLVDQITPHGNLTFNQTDTFKYTDPNTGKEYDIPRYTATQSFSPEQQAIFQSQTQAQGNMADLAAATSARLNEHMAGGIDTNSLPQGGSAGALGGMGSLQRAGPRPDLVENIADAGQIRQTYGTDFSEDRRRVEDALMSRMNPQLERDQEALRARLVGQGIREGSEAYDRAMNRFGEQSNDARMQAILAGGQEQSRLVGLEADRAGFENAAQAQQYGQNANDAEFMNSARSNEFGMELSGKGFNNDAELQEFNRSLAANQYADQKRSSALQEQFAIRNQPINEIGALLGTGQVTQPNFVNAQIGGIAGTDRAGLEMSAYNSKLDAWKTQTANRSALLGGLIGAGGYMGGAFLGG